MGGTISCLEPGKTATLLNGAIHGDVSKVEDVLDRDALALLHRGIGGLRDTAWHYAAAYGHADVLAALHRSLVANAHVVRKRLSAKYGRELSDEEACLLTANRLNVKGQTALMFACFSGQTECVQQLMKMGADPWVQDLCGGRTALHYAAMHGHVEVVQQLMAEVTSTQLTRVFGTHMVKLVDVKTVSGFSPLHYAVYNSHPGITRVFLEHGATPTSLTTVEGSFDVVQMPQWSTPLHLAAHQGNEVAARELLQFYVSRRESGMMRDVRLCADRAHRLPYHVARLRGNRALAELIHPMNDVEGMFSPAEVERLGAVRLAVLAARVLQRSLLGLVDSADAKIATLGLTQPEPASPSAGATTGVSVSRQASTKSRKASGWLQAAGRDALRRTSRGSKGGGLAGMDEGLGRSSAHQRHHSFTLDGPGQAPGEAQRDWWAVDTCSEPDIDRRASTRSTAGVGAPGISQLQRQPRPNDPSAAKPTLIKRLKSLKARSRSGAGKSLGGDEPEVDAVQASAQSTGSAVRGLPPLPDQLPAGMDDVGIARAGPGGLQLSPFACISWGTSAMIASLPSEAECSVCLEHGRSLVTVPCLHRLCVPCARRLVMGVKDKPLNCPLCRQCVKGFYAPQDVTALVHALDNM